MGWSQVRSFEGRRVKHVLLSCLPASLMDYGTWSIPVNAGTCAACLPACLPSVTTTRPSGRVDRSVGVPNNGGNHPTECNDRAERSHDVLGAAEPLGRLRPGVGFSCSDDDEDEDDDNVNFIDEMNWGRAVPCRFLPTNQAVPFPKLQRIEPWSGVEPGKRSVRHRRHGV
jgi:hypothetical protein